MNITLLPFLIIENHSSTFDDLFFQLRFVFAANVLHMRHIQSEFAFAFAFIFSFIFLELMLFFNCLASASPAFVPVCESQTSFSLTKRMSSAVQQRGLLASMCGLYILDSGMFVWGVVFHMQNTGYVCKIQLCFALVLFFVVCCCTPLGLVLAHQ